MAHSASPAKLRDGSWGARVQGSASVGDSIEIVAKSGKRWTARVTRVVWTGQGVTLVATSSDRPTPSQSSVERTYQRRYGWDGKRGSSSYYTSGMYDEES